MRKTRIGTVLLVLGSLIGSRVAAADADSQSVAVDEARRLSRMQRRLTRLGRFGAAHRAARRVVRLLERALGTRHPYVAGALNSLALSLQRLGSHRRSVPLLRRALRIYEAALGANHPYVAVTLGNLGLARRALGRLDEAERLHRRALAIEEAALGPRHPRVATSLNNLASVYQARAQHGRAVALYRRALAIRERAFGSTHPKVAVSLNNLASVLRQMGSLGRAGTLFERALRIQEAALGSRHPALAPTLVNLALVRKQRARFDASERLSRRALRILEDAYGADHPQVAAALNNLGELFRARGDHAAAGRLYRRALGIVEKLFGTQHAHVASALNNLAHVRAAQGRLARAERLYRRALAVTQGRLGREHPRVAVVLGNLARLLLLRGRPRESERLLVRALAIRERALGADHPAVAHSLFSLGELRHWTGDLARAEPLYRRALAIREKALGEGHPDVPGTIIALAVLRQARGDLPGALSLFQRHAALRERSVALILASGSERQRDAYLRKLEAEPHAVVSFHLRALPHSRVAARLAFSTILRRKGRVLEAMAGSLEALRRRLEGPARRLLDELAATRSQLAKRVLGRGQPGGALQIADLPARAERLEKKLVAQSAAYRLARSAVRLEALQARIPKGAALVEYFRYFPFLAAAKGPRPRWGRPRFAAYLLRPQGEPAWFDLGDASRIEKTTARLRRALADPANDGVKRRARALWRRVLRPLESHLQGVTQLLVSPDGALDLVPFGALVDDQGRYLVSRLAITHLTTGRALVRMGAERPARGGPVIVAAPRFGDRPADQSPATAEARTGVGRRRWQPLPGSAREAREVQALLPSARLFTGADASEKRLKLLRGPSVLHVATHGFFQPADQASAPGISGSFFPAAPGRRPPRSFAERHPLLRSGLVLAGAAAGGLDGEDGMLTALEASGLDLSGTRLVVLSACETGLGEIRSGRGVYGLRRALELAGARRLVMSLWKVDDRSTRQLMIALYDGLKRGLGAAVALQHAQRAFLGKKRLAHPIHWAAFIGAGDWRPIRWEDLAPPSAGLRTGAIE